MLKELNESLGKAFKLFESDGIEIEEVEPKIEEMPDEEIEVKEVEGSGTDLEEKVSELEEKIDNIETMLGLDEKPEIDEFEFDADPTEDFANKVRKDFIFYSKYPEDVEITEELLDKRACKNSYIPAVAVKNRVSRQEVIDTLLGRWFYKGL